LGTGGHSEILDIDRALLFFPVYLNIPNDAIEKVPRNGHDIAVGKTVSPENLEKGPRDNFSGPDPVSGGELKHLFQCPALFHPEASPSMVIKSLTNQ